MQQRRNSTLMKMILLAFGSLLAVSMSYAGSVIGPADDGGRPAIEPPRGVRGYGPSAGVVKRIVPDSVEPGSSTNRAPGVSVRISAASMAGSVSAFALTPDGATAVYIADQDVVGRYELYSVPVDVDAAVAPTKISAGLAFGAGDTGVVYFQISSDGGTVVFLADANAGAGNNDVYSVPVAGGAAPTQLNLAAQGPVTGVGIASNGTTVAFFGPATTSGSGTSEVYRATVGSAGSGIQLSNASTTNTGGQVLAADFSADSSHLIYAADESADDVFQWHGVSLSATGPGTDVQLSSALGFVNLGVITPDGATLVYTADETLLGVMDLFSIPVAGGTKRKLNPSMAGDGVTSVSVSADSLRVAYLADQVTPGVAEVFGAELLVAASGVRLNTPLSGTQSTDVVTMAPDNMTVLYESDENLAGTYELMSAPADAGASPSTLDSLAPPSSAGYFSGIGTPVVGRRAVYPVVAGNVNLFSVRYDGSAASNRINDQLGSGKTVRDAFVPTAATRMMAYGVGADGVTETLFTGPVRSDLSPEQVNAAAAAGALGVLGYEIAADEVHVVYLQDETTSGKPELYSRELDSDHDGVGNASDNCSFFSNPGQGAVRLTQTVVAADGQTFVWPNAQDLRWVRGPLASVSTLAVDDSGTLVEAESFSDPSVPASGAGFYYLFALDCDGRSYQTTAGAEPNRDIAGLP
jgi:hypothetical protein